MVAMNKEDRRRAAWMKKRQLAFILSILLFISVIPVSAMGDNENQADRAEDYGTPGVDYAEGEVIVCVNGGKDALAKRSRSVSYQVEELMDVTVTADTDTPMTMNALADNPNGNSDSEKMLVLVKGQGDVADLIEDLESNPSVEYAEPNYFVKLYDERDTSEAQKTDVSETPKTEVPETETEISETETSETKVPEADALETAGYQEVLDTEAAKPGFTSERNDPYFGYQWALKNQTDTGAGGVDANVTAAWNTAAAADKTVVAVIDTGVDYNHEDLKDVMWDDGLNYPVLTELGGGKYGANYAGGNTDDPMDTESGHGTHCAGIIAAQSDNAAGVSGVAQGAEIMALRMFGEEAKEDTAIKCYAYIQAAKDAGVNVTAINNSWGPSNYYEAELKSVATAVTTLGKKGIVSCFASGNSGTDNDLNPGGVARSPYTIRVSAIESRGHAALFSCYGESMVDIFAPGVAILSTVTTDTSAGDMCKNPPQYLPQLMEPAANYFYEDFEGDDSDVTLKLLDENGNVKAETKAAAPGAGFIESKGAALPLDTINEGEGYYIEMTIPKEKFTGMAANPSEQNDPVYLAFQGRCEDAMLGEYLLALYKNEAGQWTPLYTANGSQPANICFDNYGFNQSSGKISNDNLSFLEGNQNGNITIRFTSFYNYDYDKNIGVMNGRGEHPAFYLDNLGFGKEAVPYAFLSGTSMAAPVVTGIAALASQTVTGTDEERAAEVCARIKGSANRDDTTDLMNTCVTEGMVDAGTAVSSDESAFNPVLNTLDMQNDITGVLKGYFFGSIQGTLMASGADGVMNKLEVKNWTDREIFFTPPEDFTGRYQLKVIRADGKYGRDFFLTQQTARGYTGLPAPELSYEDLCGYGITSADAFTMGLGAAGNTILRIALLTESNQAVAEVYDVEHRTWGKASLPEGLTGNWLSLHNENMKIADGLSKIYLKYKSEPADQWMLGIYDTETGMWETVPAEFKGGEALAVYQNQLLAIGSAKQISENGNDSNNFELSADIKVVDPSTGALTDSKLKLPEEEGTAWASASGNVLAIYKGTNGSTMIYDGSAWSVTKDTFFNGDNEMFDALQALDIGCHAVNNGLIASGPVQNLGKDNMRDTWSFDKTQKVWSSREDVLYHSEKTTLNMAVCLNGKFYELSRGRLDSPLIFRSLAVNHTGPTMNPGECENPGGNGTPDPTPIPGTGTIKDNKTPPIPNISGKKKAVKTGDTADMAPWFLLLTGSIILAVNRGKKRQLK